MAETKITYATMSGDRMEDLHRALDAAIERVPATFGRSYRLMIGGRGVGGRAGLGERSRSDSRILPGPSKQASREQTREAIAAARAAYPAWSSRPWAERVELLKKVADGIRARRWELAALMGYEAGKNRLECVGDVEESADLIEYYCNQIEQHEGFQLKLGTLGPGEENTSVLPVRRVGRDRAVQFSARARRRSCRRRACRREHHRPQAGVGDAAAVVRALRDCGCSGNSGRRLQLRHRRR